MADIETGLGIPVSAYADEDSAKNRVKELLEEYKGIDALSVHYFSLQIKLT